MNTLLKSLNEFPPAIGFIALFALFCFFSFLLRWFWKNVLIKIARKTATNLDRRIFESTVGAAQLTFIAAGFNFSWDMFGSAIMKNFHGIKIVNISFIEKVMSHLGFMFLSFSVFLLIWKAIMAILDWFEHDVATKTETTLDEKIVFSVRKIIKAIMIVFMVMIITDHFGQKMSKLWTMAGIGSFAIAFAAKDTLANIISGVIILFDRPFLVGDRIELADGTFGDVKDIGIRSTQILSFDNTIHIIPNAEISTQRITNHTYPNIQLKVAHNIGVAYGSDMKKVKNILNDILKERPEVLNYPEWGIWFTEFGDSSLNLFIRYWISDYKSKFDIIDAINMEINRRFEEEKIEIPFPQRDIHMKSDNK